MDEQKQIEEMAEELRHSCEGECFRDKDGFTDCDVCKACLLYNAGYRKQSEGHWLIIEYEYFTCSKCGYYHPNGCDTTKEAKEKLADGIYPKYCAECGAKMKGGAE